MEGEEVILAEERNVILKSKRSDGTLVLTNKRILFVPATQAEALSIVGSKSISATSGRTSFTLYYTDIRNLGDVSKYESSPDFLAIQIRSIVDVKGRKGLLHPSLEVKWNSEDLTTKNVEFLQRITGRTKRINLTDWANAIERIRNSTKLNTKMPEYSSIDQDVMARTVIGVLSDLQEKGLYGIQREIETSYQIGQEIDSDDLKSKCQSLVEKGILSVDETGEFYWIRSPIEDIVS